MNQNQLSDYLATTSQSIWIGLTIIPFIFPPWLIVSGKIFNKLGWQEWMSAYYHAIGDSLMDALQKDEVLVSSKPAHHGEGTMRNWFVGLLFGVGIILNLYGFHVAGEIGP